MFCQVQVSKILDKESIKDRVIETFKDFVANQINAHLAPEGYLTNNDLNNIIERFNNGLLKKKKLNMTVKIYYLLR